MSRSRVDSKGRIVIKPTVRVTRQRFHTTEFWDKRKYGLKECKGAVLEAQLTLRRIRELKTSCQIALGDRRLGWASGMDVTSVCLAGAALRLYCILDTCPVGVMPVRAVGVFVWEKSSADDRKPTACESFKRSSPVRSPSERERGRADLRGSAADVDRTGPEPSRLARLGRF